MENKTGKYLKYAIGEIILVVIGILIALQINNWNENRKLRDKTQVYLELLLEGLEKETENVNNEFLYLTEYIEGFETYEAQFSELKTLQDVINGLSQINPKTNTPEFKIDAVETLTSTGDIQLIPINIREKIIDLTRLQDWHQKILERNNELFINRLHEVGIKGWSLSMRRISTNPELVKIFSERPNKNLYLADLIKAVDYLYHRKYTNYTNYLADFKNMLKDIDELTQMVKEELRQNY